MKHLVSVLIVALFPIQALALGPDETYPDVEHDEPLNEAELRAAFTGKKHLGSYNFLNHGISSYAFEETTGADGSIKHVQDGRIDTGKWKITKNVICYDYDAHKSVLQNVSAGQLLLSLSSQRRRRPSIWVYSAECYRG